MRLVQSGVFSTFAVQAPLVVFVVLLFNVGADGFVVSVPRKVTQESVRLTRSDASIASYTHDSKGHVVRRGHRCSKPSRRSTEAGMSAEETSVGFSEKVVTAWNTVIPVGDPDDLPPCPSGISSLPKPLQVRGILLDVDQGAHWMSDFPFQTLVFKIRFHDTISDLRIVDGCITCA